MTNAIVLKNLVKRYGEMLVVDDIDLDVPEGAFVSLLGASGCGKTTTLRLIAGLETANSGRILFRGQDITDVPPSHRDMRMMFQDYALFPNLSVYQNIEFPLKLRRTRARFEGSRDRRVRDYIDLVQMGTMADRMPHQLSGGQRQRVALARALVTDPAVVLFDEPLGALDAALRHAMQYELKRIHAETGKTFVYVTHDQEEAMAMSDLIAVMKGGKIVQLASPQELYARPVSRYVAEFVGSSSSMLDAIVSKVNASGLRLRTTSGLDLVSEMPQTTPAVGQPVTIHLRAEQMELVPGHPASSVNSVPAEIVEFVFLGGRTQYHVRLDDTDRTNVTVALAGPPAEAFCNGAKVTVRIDPRNVGVLFQ